MPKAPSDQLDAKCPLTLVHGPAASLRQRVIDPIAAENLPESEREWGLLVLDAPELGADSVAAQLAVGSLIAPTRVIVVRNVGKLPAAAQKTLAAALSSLSPGTTVVLDVEDSGDYRSKGPRVAADLR